MISRRSGGQPLVLTESAERHLQSYSFPNNLEVCWLSQISLLTIKAVVRPLRFLDQERRTLNLTLFLAQTSS